MSINDVYECALKNGFTLNESEANIIYNCIKSNWEIIVYGDYMSILNNYNSKLNPDLLSKIKDLIVLYRNKYKQLL